MASPLGPLAAACGVSAVLALALLPSRPIAGRGLFDGRALLTSVEKGEDPIRRTCIVIRVLRGTTIIPLSIVSIAPIIRNIVDTVPTGNGTPIISIRCVVPH